MSERAKDDDRPKCSLYILGAGFSRAAGLPLGTELWSELLRRGLSMRGRASKFRHDLEHYIRYRRDCDGQALTPETVNFEDFLGFLDIEHHLGLPGSDTWSADGNESQIVTKMLIGQILTERTPKVPDIPELYISFANTLRPYDTIITFNYDILLERALEAARIPYRLFPERFESVSEFSATLGSNEQTEIVILKLHGSVDWFDKRVLLSESKTHEPKGIHLLFQVIQYSIRRPLIQYRPSSRERALLMIPSVKCTG